MNKTIRIEFLYFIVFSLLFVYFSILNYLNFYDYYIFPALPLFLISALSVVVLALVLLFKRKWGLSLVLFLCLFVSFYSISFQVTLIDYLRVSKLIGDGSPIAKVMWWGDYPLFTHNYETVLVNTVSDDLTEIKKVIELSEYSHLVNGKCELNLRRVRTDFVVVRAWC
ncbi:hypothetical protein ABLO27_17615 [Roseibium sp. SCPC15]|uniref:hypothetical protein n=1 Tax=Roseibium sp. SCP15 TaxID=3141376 RepID=UPI00333B3C12